MERVKLYKFGLSRLVQQKINASVVLVNKMLWSFSEISRETKHIYLQSCIKDKTVYQNKGILLFINKDWFVFCIVDHEMWHLAYSSALCDEGPGSRHGHSAVVHDGFMWVYGGMEDLHIKNDIWKWHFSKNLHKISLIIHLHFLNIYP